MKLILLGLIGSIALASSAQAHVVFNQTNVPAGALATLEMRVTHGCNGSPTTQVKVKIPEGVTRVTPRALAGWTVEEAKRRLPAPVTLHGQTMTETVDSITWKGGSFPDFAYQQFELRAMMPSDGGRPLYFPVEQTCASGAISWSQVPASPAGWGALATPAPFVTLGSAAVMSTGHRH